MTENRALVLAPEFVVPAEKIAGRIEELQSFVKAYMIEGEDYGTIPGTAKPTLYKPGAEKLCDVYGFQRLFDVMNRVEDWDKGLFHYEIRASLVDARTGLVIAQGLGCANSKEARYRWRQAERHCPSCGVPAIIKGKAEYGGGWVCFKKKGGCGDTFTDDDAQIVDQHIGRVENDDPFTLVNTLLKMAKKRALVDAVLSATRSSGLFTQDIEDFIEGSAVSINGGDAEAKPAAAEQPKARRRQRSRDELAVEGQQIARQRQDGPEPWACSRCRSGEAIPGTERNCPKCGHLRGTNPAEAQPEANGITWSRLWVVASEQELEKPGVHAFFGAGSEDGDLKAYAGQRAEKEGLPLQQVVENMADELQHRANDPMPKEPAAEAEQPTQEPLGGME